MFTLDILFEHMQNLEVKWTVEWKSYYTPKETIHKDSKWEDKSMYVSEGI